MKTVGDKINKANAAINYLNDLNAAYDENMKMYKIMQKLMRQKAD